MLTLAYFGYSIEPFWCSCKCLVFWLSSLLLLAYLVKVIQETCYVFHMDHWTRDNDNWRYASNPTCCTTITVYLKLIFGCGIADVEGTIFGVDLLTVEILQINAKFIIFLYCESTYFRISYKIYIIKINVTSEIHLWPLHIFW